jgi:hypothetical protein
MIVVIDFDGREEAYSVKEKEKETQIKWQMTHPLRP